MARGYPRFLFSNPQNVKTPGPFIVHTIYPRFIAVIKSIEGVEGNEWRYTITSWDEAPQEEIDKAVKTMKEWFGLQLLSGEITLSYVVKNIGTDSHINDIVYKLLKTELFKIVYVATSHLKQSPFTLEVEAINGYNISVPISNTDTYEQVFERLKQKNEAIISQRAQGVHKYL